MREYHKIETIFERDMDGSKKLIEGKYRNECVEYLKDLQWVFTEKVDGTNIRIHWDGHKVSIGGRTDNAQLPTPLVAHLQEKFMTQEAEQLFEQKFADAEVTLYGEGYGGKIQGGGAYSKEQKFILFDVQIGHVYLNRESQMEIAIAFDIPQVPIILTGTIQEAVDFVKEKPLSYLASLNEEKYEMEGLVGTPKVRLTDWRGNRIIVKIKTKDFL